MLRRWMSYLIELHNQALNNLGCPSVLSESTIMDNKWTNGITHIDASHLPADLIVPSGIKVVPAVLDVDIGEEIILLITEPKYQIADFKDRNITRLDLQTGVVRTSFGPICFLLFSFPDPRTGSKIVYESAINPTDERHLSIYKQLSVQTHWHVILATTQGDTVNFFEFPDKYELGKALDQVVCACSGMMVVDFVQAKREYEAKYPIERLLSMSAPN